MFVCDHCGEKVLTYQMIRRNIRASENTIFSYDMSCPYCHHTMGRMLWGRYIMVDKKRQHTDAEHRAGVERRADDRRCGSDRRCGERRQADRRVQDRRVSERRTEGGDLKLPPYLRGDRRPEKERRIADRRQADRRGPDRRCSDRRSAERRQAERRAEDRRQPKRA